MAMKFRAHDTFFIRKGWLSKGMKYVCIKSDVFVAKDENPMDVLGIGANMVKALRYWLQAVGLTVEPNSGKRSQSFTKLGDSIFEHDRYIEELGTLYLLQYRLASNKEEATAWYYFFNVFNMTEFSRDDFVDSILRWIKMEEGEDAVAIRSLNDDFSCINSINPWVALAVIVDQANGAKEISLNELLTAPCNIGRVFNLDAITMLDVLYQVERLNKIKINRTAGLDVIRILDDLDFQDCVDAYYNSINNQ